MDNNYGFNGNLQYPQYPSKNSQNQYQNNNNSQNINNKLYNIKETDTDIYIERNKQNSIIKIPKSFNNRIYIVENEYEYMNINPIKNYQCDSIIGIFDLKDNKYLCIVTSSKVAAKVLGNFIFNIISIELIKITFNNESISDINFINDIKNLFLKKNFYYSNDYDLTLSLYNQYKINSYDYNGNNSNKKQLKSKYLINSSLLKYFVDNNIPECFYSTIIFGYVGCKLDVDIDENIRNITVDIIIIERYYKKNIIINNDIPSHVKEIELICNFKNKNNKNIKNTFSFIFYINSESMNNISDFEPCKTVLIEEFEQYKNITCIVNNLNNYYNDNIKINNVINKFNTDLFNNKIKLIDFTSDWDKTLFFDTNNDSYNLINFYLNNSIDVIQKNSFWFIDINNFFSDDDCCFNTFIRFMWKTIQKEINYLGLNIDIGLFDKNNNNNICNKFKDIIMKYHNDLDENKKSLYNNMNRDKIQETYNNCFISINNYNKRSKTNNNTFRNNNNNNNIYNTSRNNEYNNNIYNTSRNNNDNYNRGNNDNYNNKDNNNINKKYNDNKKNEDNTSKKIKVLCVTWNIAGISCRGDYNITELFTQNIFYHKNAPPDIIVVGIQEIIKLSITSVLSIVSNQENVRVWTDNILYTIKKVFPNTNYYELKCMDLVGIYIIVLIKSSLKDNIFLLDSNTTKTGIYGTMGNKGFFTLTLKCFDNYISFGSGHFEAGQSKNEDRIETLKQLLNKQINIYDNDNYNEYLTFKDIEYWIILGDLNFRINLSFDDAFTLIQEKKYDILYGLDQFNSVMQNNDFLKNNINEKEIKFDPTYKYVKGSNEYAYDEDKIRVPAWTDRIFYCKKKGIKMLTYDSIRSMKYSDHRPVVGTFLIYCNNNNNNNKKNKNKNENDIYNPYENIFKEEKNKNIKKDINNDLIDIDIDNNIINKLKEIKNEENNSKYNKNKYNKSKTTKNEQKIKMNYRGINFNTEISENINNKSNQNIYNFFINKQKNNNSNLIFNDRQNNNNNQDLLFESFNNNNNNDRFNNNLNNNQGMYRSNTGNNNYYNNQQNNNGNNNNNNNNNDILNLFK